MTRKPPRRAGIALLVTAVAFGAGFAAWGAVEDDDGSNSPAEVREVARPVVPINNLERAPSIKPLRSVAGEPPQESSSP